MDIRQTKQSARRGVCVSAASLQFLRQVLIRYQSWDIILKCLFQPPETKLQRPRLHRIKWLSLEWTQPPCRCAGAVQVSRLDRQWATQCAACLWAHTTPQPSATYRRKKHSDFFPLAGNTRKEQGSLTCYIMILSWNYVIVHIIKSYFHKVTWQFYKIYNCTFFSDCFYVSVIVSLN